MTDAQRNRLVGILGRLSSPYDGERAAAGLLATRLLKGLGATWDDLVLPSAAALRQGQRDPAPTPWVVDVRLCQRHPDWLRMWERDFVTSIAARRSLSRKQLGVLREIAAKLRARGAR